MDGSGYDSPAKPDGAAYDPKSDSWRRIARAPVPLLDAETAIVGDTLFVLAGKDFFAYDVPDDKWRGLPTPPTKFARLVAIDELLVAFRQTTERGSRDHYWDISAKRWRALPPLPSARRSIARWWTWTASAFSSAGPQATCIVPRTPGSLRPNSIPRHCAGRTCAST